MGKLPGNTNSAPAKDGYHYYSSTVGKINLRSTPPFKLRDRSRAFQGINLVAQFGFLPRTIIIEKIHGRNNLLTVRAVVTDEEWEKEQRAKGGVKNGKKSKSETKKA